MRACSHSLVVGTNTGRNGLSCSSFIRKYSLALNLRKKPRISNYSKMYVYPFTQLMKTRSKMVEDTIYHQNFTLKHSPGPKRGLKRCSVPSVHMGVHMLQLSEKGGDCLWKADRVSAGLLHGSSVQTASLPSPLHPSIQPPRANSCQTVSRRQTDDIII